MEQISTGASLDFKAIRKWAQAQGLNPGERGPVSKKIIDAWRAANMTTTVAMPQPETPQPSGLRADAF